jgi:hypothetical protein
MFRETVIENVVCIVYESTIILHFLESICRRMFSIVETGTRSSRV